MAASGRSDPSRGRLGFLSSLRARPRPGPELARRPAWQVQGNRYLESRSLEYMRSGDETFLTTKVDAVLNWGRKYSMFLYPFVTACCGMEFMSVAGPRYDLDRFGCALPRFSPRQADLLMVVGTITHRQAPVLKKVYDQMAEPKWVIAFGACTCSGGPYNNYATVQGIDTIIPVDVYIPGCPPRPEAVLDGLMKLQDRVQAERVPSRGRHREMDELVLPVVEKPVA